MLLCRVLWRGREYPVTRSDGGVLTAPGSLRIPGAEAFLLTPTLPTKVVCVGRNYMEHAREMGNTVPDAPLIFMKPSSSVLNPGGTILLPEDSRQVEYEGEIAVVIGRLCRRIAASEDPLSYVTGVTPLNDVTARDLQRADVQFTRAKSFDTFCPFGPWIAPVEDPKALTVRTYLNGRLVQDGRAADMAFSIPDIVRFVAGVMTLFPGDVIATGTPAGVGRLSPGDRVCVEVSGVRLENDVESHP